MDALHAALQAGLSTSQALRMVSSTTDAWGLLTPLVRAADEGRPMGHEWRRLARRMDHPDLSALARAWMISERAGSPVADAVATSANTARARTALSQRLQAATAGARATCTMLTLLPLGGLAVTSLLGLPPTQLYAHPAAAAAGLLGVALLLLGRWTVRRMISSVSAAVC
ncbi:MAG TPA: type II secretion system F family protein [Ornithinimicrobium sp.]|uniref:type II secretion system F family protein n=1 Tax=Ornithinimicrobium sp. TaxID=1977084 RepID=UPI002B4718B1|nr:type II secretion system F family protein [Ornithinimicrobium sp.]HKJ12370.1 type II secretion system F family protein [Ornithinimicrobium sp.]